MTVAQDSRHLARLIWKRGLRRWQALRPDWRPATPEFHPNGVLFRFEGPPGHISVAVDSLPAAPTSASTLKVRLPHSPDDPVVAREVVAVIETLARGGLTLPHTRPANDRKPDTGPVEAKRLELFIASGCNLRCYFCCESQRIQKKTLMPWDDVVHHIDRAADSGAGVLQFMGGEATLHPRFPDALRYAKERGMGTFVITNALAWEDRRFAEAVAPWLDEVMVSIHAFGSETGEKVTGRRTWWTRFSQALANLRETHRGEVRCSTVLNRHNAHQLEDIAELVHSLRPSRWIMGTAVPTIGPTVDIIDHNLSLTELGEMRPRFEALSRRFSAANSRLVYFCIPQCVLGPQLWNDSHDFAVDNQDLSDSAASSAAQTHFWSQAEYLSEPRPVTLARRRTERCSGCARESVCGGFFTDYFDRYGDDELQPISPTTS
jgi:pyruvate-formate lyase-activating enzyme